MQASQSLNKKATETNLQITGLRYIGALDKGRRPGRFPPVDAIRDRSEFNCLFNW
jgi:hypothetical protein